jgi:hypothetical protein
MLQSYAASAAEMGGKSNTAMTFPVRLRSNETALVNASLPAVVNARLRSAGDAVRGRSAADIMAIFRRYPEEITAQCGIPATLHSTIAVKPHLVWHLDDDFAMEIGGIETGLRHRNGGTG